MAATIVEPSAAAWNWTFNSSLPSAKDLALAGPRVIMKITSFLVPSAIDNMFSGVQLGEQRMIPEATGGGIVEAITTAGTDMGRRAMDGAAEALDQAAMVDGGSGLSSRFSLEGARSLGSIFSYATSRWALGCIAVALVLNRTTIYASTRRNLTLPWKLRFSLRIVPILLLAWQCKQMLQSIHCQTSPDFGLMRWGNASKHAELLQTQNGGPMHTISSMLLFGQADLDACLAVNMVPKDLGKPADRASAAHLTGSLSTLWPMFQTFSFSQFVETLSCAVQGRQVAAETGMTLFEHSLAFAEADAAVGSQLGFGPFGTTKSFNPANATEATEIAITRSMLLQRINTTPEVLLVGFLSGMNHLTSHTLAIFNLQGRFRLINTALWGLCFMGVIVYSVFTFTLDDLTAQSLLRFPTVCIIGFIPHVLVLFGIIVCGVIYGTALVLSALAPTPTGANRDEPQISPRATFVERLRDAHDNMQANVPLSSIRITMHMDFYTALLRTGFSIMTMASEAVYLNESRNVTIRPRTWLEDDRLREIEDVGAQWLGPTFRIQDHEDFDGEAKFDNIGLVKAEDSPSGILQTSTSPYAKEMTAKKVTAKKGNERMVRDGVGATERSGRWIMAMEFFIGITRLLLSWWATLVLKLSSKMGIQVRPRWLVHLTKRPKSTAPDTKHVLKPEQPNLLNFWVLGQDGELTLPKDDNVDVESEMRKRKTSSLGFWNQDQEQELDQSLYDWWRAGGWWGGDDSSGTFKLPERDEDDDNTSVISFSTTASSSVDAEQDWESDSSNNDGSRTPTQRSPQYTRESTPLVDNPLSRTALATLLNPKTPEQRAEAQTLAAHLASDQIITRSRYRTLTALDRSKVLLTSSTISRPAHLSKSALPLTAEEETHILEHLILTSRSQGHAAATDVRREGSGEGPQCVVCQSAPRTVIVWPCRCLSLCDDCRVSLAMNNFDKCVCCRRDVGSFSRIWVP